MAEMNVTTVPHQMPVYIKTEKGWTTQKPILSDIERHKKSKAEIAAEIISIGATIAAASYTAYQISRFFRPLNTIKREKIISAINSYKKELLEIEKNVKSADNISAQNVHFSNTRLNEINRYLRSTKDTLKSYGTVMTKNQLEKLSQEVNSLMGDDPRKYSKDAIIFYNNIETLLSGLKHNIKNLKQKCLDNIDIILEGDKDAKFEKYPDLLDLLESTTKNLKGQILETARTERRHLSKVKNIDIQAIKSKEKVNEKLYNSICSHIRYILENISPHNA